MPRLGEQLGVLRRPVVADDADQLHRREEAGGEREVGGRAAEQIVAAAPGRFDVINGDRADDEQGHRCKVRKAEGGRWQGLRNANCEFSSMGGVRNPQSRADWPQVRNCAPSGRTRDSRTSSR